MATKSKPALPLTKDVLPNNIGINLTTDIKPSEPAPLNENGNFRIAENLSIAKAKLVTALAQFPLSALWLVHKYQESTEASEIDDSEEYSVETDTSLEQIKNLMLYTSQTARTGKAKKGAYYKEQQKLIFALQGYRFTFEDLIELTDLVLLTFEFRGLIDADQPDQQSDSINKRLQQAKHRSQGKFHQLRDCILTNNIDPEFAFLPVEFMRNQLTEVATAEHDWLAGRQQLAGANSRLVLFIANQYKGGFLDFDDLVQEGQTGLLKAVDRYNHELGFQFSTYAGYWIRQAISRALTRSERVVRLPFGQMANINKVYRAKDELMSKTGREPSRAELAQFTSLTINEINNILSISQTALSFDGDSDDEEQSFGPADFLEQQIFTPAFGSIAETELEQLLNGAIETLDTREAKVIRSHFGVNCDCEMTLQEIGNELNLTRERVRQIQVAALNKIRRSFGEQLLSFL